MKRVAWENIGVDRMGCAWLITRLIDPEAEFVFVRPGERALPDDGEPFDVPGTRLSHRRGHSSFHTMVQEYRLKDPVLHRLARMVDEADVTQEVTVDPAAPDLELICRGVRRTSPDDQVALERGRLVYDALYAELGADPTS